ncbi:MAG: GFA family protein [Deltaproteobacteria bacterium]|nr:GFA family protein [Deltaproteobacteria bacterium]
MDRCGKCLCGEVEFVAKGLSGEASACHCKMCRRWSGASWIGVFTQDIEWTRKDALGVIQSSAWAERGFCTKCGSGLFYRVTAEGKHQGVTSVSFGCLDDQSDVSLTKEWFIDKKPEAYGYAGERKTVTEAEVLAMFGGG